MVWEGGMSRGKWEGVWDACVAQCGVHMALSPCLKRECVICLTISMSCTSLLSNFYNAAPVLDPARALPFAP